MKSTLSILFVGILILFLLLSSGPKAQAQSSTVTFAAIGDYGSGDDSEGAVAAMVSGWNPDMILGLGDSYYIDAGGDGDQKYDLSVGKFYCNFLKDINTITGTFCPTGQAPYNKFFPALGDHDYDDAGTINGLPVTYTNYFNLPGSGYTSSSNNERYYDFVYGPVHFFVLNTYDEAGGEPDGITSASVQGEWLRTQLAASTSTWNVVVAPNPPYSSGAIHGSTVSAQWPYAQWGADAVLSGDDHLYERIVRDGMVYFVDGLGGARPYSFRMPPVTGSMYRFDTTNGALRVTASDTLMTFEFYSIENGGTLKDTYTITVPHNTATPTIPSNSTGWQSPSIQAASNNNGYEVNPTNAFTDDGLVAMDVNSGTSTVLSCTDTGKDKHKFYGYNITIPNGSFVQGIQVRLDADADSIVGTPKLCVSLSWNGGSNWSDWKTSPNLSVSEETYLLGGTSDIWGHTWATGELSNSNFQVRIADIASDNSRDFSLDWIAVNIIYSIGSTATQANTFTATSTPVDTLTFTSTVTPSNTPAFTSTSAATSTPTSTETYLPSNTPTDTSVPTSTATHTPTVTNTATSTSTSTASNTPTLTSIPTFTHTFTFTPTDTPISTFTNTPIFTSTNALSTIASTATATNTPTSISTATPTKMPTITATSTSIGFGDVPTEYWAQNFVERLYKAGITGGCLLNPLKYCPEATVTRAQMAVFLERGIHGSSYNPLTVGESTGFGDVPPDYWSAAWIKQLAAEGVTGGCGSGNYCPESPVTRAQMAVFLLRSKYGTSYSPPDIGGSTGFGDVPPDYWSAAWIKQLVTEGITAGCGNGTYCPEAPVTRAQMAVFLVKMFNLP
jgi:tartrate-resistant acid phosphatase type 5